MIGKREVYVFKLVELVELVDDVAKDHQRRTCCQEKSEVMTYEQ